MEVVVLAIMPGNGEEASSEGEGRDSTLEEEKGAGWKGVN